MVAQPLFFPMGRRLMVTKGKEPAQNAIIVKPQALEVAELHAHLPGKAKDFLQLLDQGTYFKHGYHQQQGTPEHWCKFELTSWAQQLGCKKPNVHRTREYLLALHIIQVQVIEGQMWIGWNLNTDEWIPAPLWGGKRDGAGRPQKNQDDNVDIQDDNGYLPQKQNQDDNKTFQDDNVTDFKMITSELDGPAWGAVPDDPLRNRSKKPLRRSSAHAEDGVAVATQEVRAPPLPDDASKIGQEFGEDDRAYKLAAYFYDKVAALDPVQVKNIAKTPKGLAIWREKARMLLDRADSREIGRTIDYLFSPRCWWYGKILTMPQFHLKFNKLHGQMSADRNGGSHNGQTANGIGRTAPNHAGSRRDQSPGGAVQGRDNRRAKAAAVTGGARETGS